MKRIIIFFSILFFNALLAQDKNYTGSKSRFELGIFGGINFETISESGSTFIIEVKNNIIFNLDFNISLGYPKSFSEELQTVRTYYTGIINNTQYYFAVQFNITKRGYDIFPVSLSFSYIFKKQNLSPYYLIDFNYNFISAKNYIS